MHGIYQEFVSLLLYSCFQSKNIETAAMNQNKHAQGSSEPGGKHTFPQKASLT